MSPELRTWLLLAGAVAGYLLLVLASPVRGSLRDGLRCLRRYPALWVTLAVFGFSYGAFQAGLRWMELSLLPAGERSVLPGIGSWAFPPLFQVELAATARAGVLPAFESLAGLFNNVVTTFPVSALAAFLLLVNWQGHHRVLNRALRRRYGGWGWDIYAGIVVCALAALAKPFVLYAGLPTLAERYPGAPLLPLSLVLDWLSFLFEYLFGVCIQVMLILLVYVWVRGMSFTYRHLLDFAIRRFSSVMKWAAVVLALSTALIHLPLILSSLPPFSERLAMEEVVAYVDRLARPFLAFFLIFFSTLQVTLTFHGESLRQAVRDHFSFVRRNGAALFWFLVVGFVHFYGYHFLEGALVRGLGDGTGPALLWQMIAPIFGALIAGWLLASWVCVYKRADRGRSGEEEWVAF